MDDYSSLFQASDKSFYKQSGFYVNENIQIIYMNTSRMLGLALNSAYRGFTGKKYENTYRKIAVDGFQVMVMQSAHLPGMKGSLEKLKEEDRGFKDYKDLQLKIATALSRNVRTAEILRWFNSYVEAMVDIGLIKLYTLDDNPFEKFRR